MRLLKCQSKNCWPMGVTAVVVSILFAFVISTNAGENPNGSTVVIATSISADENDELAKLGLPPDVGREEVDVYCSACHSLKLVAQQGLSKQDWSELFDWMVEEQEMEAMSAEDRKLVLNYLAKHRGRNRVRKLR